MNTDERVMRGMTHLNIGATVALLLWVLSHGALAPSVAPAVAPAVVHGAGTASLHREAAR